MIAGRASEQPWGVVVALGVMQIISWGSVFYVFALLLAPLQHEIGADKTTITGAYSIALLLSGLAVTAVGRTIDRNGGRRVMTAGSIAVAVGLAALSQVESVVALYAVWAVLGVAMAATLYEPAFAVIAHAFAGSPRRALTVVTLFGGFASTVFWPLTAWLIEWYGWRNAVLALAAINLLVCAPLHAFVLPMRAVPARESGTVPAPAAPRLWSDPRFVGLTLAFLLHYLVISSIAAHLIALLGERGMDATAAALIGALIGPMQVVGRLVEFGASRWLTAAQAGRVAVLLLPLALGVLSAAGTSTAALALFAALYGAGNGAMTVVRAALPVELYGRAFYGAVLGAMTTPGLLARAAGPFAAAGLWSFAGGYRAVNFALIAAAVLGAAAFFLATRVAPAQQGASS
jgi:MFS family permease